MSTHATVDISDRQPFPFLTRDSRSFTTEMAPLRPQIDVPEYEAEHARFPYGSKEETDM